MHALYLYIFPLWQICASLGRHFSRVLWIFFLAAHKSKIFIYTKIHDRNGFLRWPPRGCTEQKKTLMTSQTARGKGREWEREIDSDSLPELSWAEARSHYQTKKQWTPHTHALGAWHTRKHTSWRTHLGYKCFHCSSSEARDDHWQWAKIVALLPESRQQQDAFCQPRLARVLPYIFYCSGSWKEMKIVLCGYAKKYAMRFFTGHAQQQRQLARKKFK